MSTRAWGHSLTPTQISRRPITPRHRRRSTLRLAAGPIVVGLLLTGCSSSDDTSTPTSAADSALPTCPIGALDNATKPVELVVWHSQQGEPLATLNDLVDEYNSSQDKVVVRAESQGTSYQELQTKFNSSVASRDLPGVVMFDDTSTQAMADSGVILPAQSCLDAEGSDTSAFVQTGASYYTIDDVLWPGSANLAGALVYYNRDHFAQAGLDPDKPPTTLAEVRSYAEAIKAAGITDRPLVHELSAWKTEFWLTGAGSSVVDNDNGRGQGETTAATLAANPDAIELLTWFQQMNDDGLMQALPSRPGQIDQYLAVANSSASMLIESSSAATTIASFLGGTLDPADLGDVGSPEATEASGLDIGAGAFPVMHPGDSSQVGGAAWYMTNTTAPEVQAAAWDFLTFMNGIDAQAQMLISGSFIPYLKAANDSPLVRAYYDDNLAGSWLELAAGDVAAINPEFPGPLIGPYSQFRVAIDDAQGKVAFGSTSPTEALSAAQSEVDADIQEYNDSGF